MLLISLLLAGLAFAMSGVALAIAISRDLRDRDRRMRPRPAPRASMLSGVRPTLLLWPSSPREAGEHGAATIRFPQSHGPDVMIAGPRTTSVVIDPEDAPRKAA